MKKRIFLAVVAVCAAAAAPVFSQAQQSKTSAGNSGSSKTSPGSSSGSSLPSQQKTTSEGTAQSSGQATAEAAAKDPFVIEKYVTKLRFENDGTGERELKVRVRAQTEAGVKQLKTLIFSYDKNHETVSIGEVRLIPKGGTAKTLGAENVKDVESPVVKDAPAYANLRQKEVTVDGLAEGSTIEYEVTTKIQSAFIPGEFCYEHSFVDAAVVLDEELEVNVPAGREVTVRSAKNPDSKQEAAGRTTYRWKHANLNARVNDKGDSGQGGAGGGEEQKAEAAESSSVVVEITSFRSWEQVAKWYAQLMPSDAMKDSAVAAKAQEITKGPGSEGEKIAAIYKFVAQQIRYISLPFNEGHYQPMKPAEVLKNGYGDSQGKYFLLAAMLDALGVKAETALINSSRKMNEQAPSPAQFDHVLATIPQGDAQKAIWLDAAPDVAPFGYLLPNLRGKNALVISAEGAEKIERTPENPPFASSEIVNVDARLSELGKLTAKVKYELRGDNEFAFRSAFRRTPEGGWNQIGQTVALLDGLQGQVSNVHASDPLDTAKPFELSFDFAQKRAADWAQKKSTLSAPLPSVGMPPAPKKDVRVDLGTPLDVTLNLKLDYPVADTLTAPVGVTVMRDYAEYRSSYKVEGHELEIQRVVRFKMDELEADRAEDYRAFTRAALADQNQPITVSQTPKDANAVAASAKADELVEAGDTALDGGNAQAAIELLRRASKLEPSRKDIWNNLGLAYLRLGQVDPAVNAFQTQIRLSSKDAIAHDYLGAAYMQEHKDEDAIGAFRKQLEINPLDKFAHASLGVLYFQEGKYTDAQPELEKAAILNPDNAQIEITLGKCYAKNGKTSEAQSTFEKAVQISPSGEIFNAVAYEMVQDNLDLEKAQEYAASAVKAVSESLRDVDLDHLTLKDLADVQDIGAFWETLGLIHLRQGDLDGAAIYLECAWRLTQNGTTGKHLGEVYEKQGKKDLAAETQRIVAASAESGEALVRARTFGVAAIPGSVGKADFFILLGSGSKDGIPGSKAERLKFVRGSESLKKSVDALKQVDFGTMIPPGTAAKLVRRGTLTCSATECSLVFELPQDVKSLE